MGTPLANNKHEEGRGEEANTDPQNISTTDEGNMCSICQDTEISTAMYALPCAHKFHEQCINEWLKTKLICPICRLSIDDGNASDPYGEGDGFEPYNDELMQSSVELIASDGEEDEVLFIGHTADLSNTFSVNIYVDSSESNADLESADPDSNNTESDAERETYEFETEQETTESETDTDSCESETEQETSDSDDEPEMNESDEESEISDINSGTATSESSEESEISVSDTESDYESYSE